MRVFIVASDEPMYLVPYIARVIRECRAEIVGVGVHAPAAARLPLRRLVSLVLLALVMSSPRQWWRLLVWRVRDVLAAAGVTGTRHHLADVCRDAGIAVHEVRSVNADTFVALLREQRIDVLLHQTSEILRGPIIQAPAVAVLNRHMSLLPAYRGAWPLFWQLANGETTVGVSLHVVDEGLDSGAVVAQEAVRRNPGESPAALMARLFDRSVPLTCAAFERLREGKPAAQPAATGTVFRTPTPAQVLRFLWSQPEPRA